MSPFLDNCSGHRVSDQVQNSLDSMKTKLVFLSANATHLFQPLNYFIIQNLKSVWRREWENEKINLITSGNWSDGYRSSGKLINPGKTYYMRLAIQCVNEAKSMFDDDGISLPRKSMIKYGTSLQTRGQ